MTIDIQGKRSSCVAQIFLNCFQIIPGLDGCHSVSVSEATGDPKLPQLQSRYQVLSQEYSRFSKAAGLRTQVERTQVVVVGTKWQKLQEKTPAVGIGSPKTDLDYIASEEYKAKFSSISDSPKLNRAIYERCRAAVTHQSGKFTEDLSIVDLQGNLIGATSSKVAYETQYSQSLKSTVMSAEPYSLVSIHDHGTNAPPLVQTSEAQVRRNMRLVSLLVMMEVSITILLKKQSHSLQNYTIKQLTNLEKAHTIMMKSRHILKRSNSLKNFTE